MAGAPENTQMTLAAPRGHTMVENASPSVGDAQGRSGDGSSRSMPVPIRLPKVSKLRAYHTSNGARRDITPDYSSTNTFASTPPEVYTDTPLRGDFGGLRRGPTFV